jgi:WD repeat-containing protein 23
MDTRYLISNSKDQSIKLWDMRRFANQSTIEKSRDIANKINNGWDYRYEAYGPRRKNSFVFITINLSLLYLAQKCEVPGDPSVRTYRGHSVDYTLIRCYFSPSFTTGQKYIITGSSDGWIRGWYFKIFF